MGKKVSRKPNQLSAKEVSDFAKRAQRGRLADGGGLYLQCSQFGSTAWVFEYTRNGKTRSLGLGGYPLVSLAAARQAATAYREMLYRVPPVDPYEFKMAHARERADRLTFDQCAEKYIAAHKAGWRNAKHAEQWTNTLTTYASPVFGSLPVADIDTALVMRVLSPIWTEKTETATRLRGRIENVLGWATVQGFRTGDNPARWRGHLDKLLPKRSRVAPVRHHMALHHADMPAFVVELRKREGMAAKALEFVILTAARVSEAVNAEWSEIDLEARMWTVPGARMKAGREHVVPLSDAAVALLAALPRQSGYVFPGWKAGKPLTGAACLHLLDDMGHAELTVHGFRSTFRTWAAEATNFPRELAEAALAHVIKDKTEAAYQRGAMLERRRKLMDAWATYCGKKPGNVVHINGATPETVAGNRR